jgi:hypothetical protein
MADMTLMDEGLSQVSFEAWDDPEVDELGVEVDGPYSHTAWLPVLGATTWLVWGAVVTRLGQEGRVDCPLGELAPPWVVNPAVVAWSLDRLEAFGLASTTGDTWAVRRVCPPLFDRQLARAPSRVRALHHVTFTGENGDQDTP